MDTLLQEYQALRNARAPWESWWETLREYVLPERSPQYGGSDVADADSAHRLSDTTAVEACQKLAGGHMSYITPSAEQWFKWGSPDPAAGDEEAAWYNRCSEIAARELALSNFYTELHECFLDRVGLGTGCLFCAEGRDGHLLFRHIPCGQFVCAENDEGQVDTFMREFRFTPHQAALRFGERALGPRAAAQLQSAPNTASLGFLHIVRPRAKRDRRRSDAQNMAFESIYYSLDDNCRVQEGGYREMPYMVTRFLRWGEGVYGLAPARLVYPDIRQAQFLNRILDMLGEIAAFPRVLELANQVGEVDLRAGGRTLINPESASLGYPREWATAGRYDVGVDRLKAKQESIRRAFFVPMLELWENNTRQMSASEVIARENERVMLFSPSFTLFTCDFAPMMERIFALLCRSGRLPLPPQSARRTDRRNEEYIDSPHVVYQGRIAQALRRRQAEGVDRTLQRLQQLAQLDPGLADHIDLERSFRLSARLDGVSEEVLRPEAEVARLRRKREAEAAAAAQSAARSAAQNPAETPSR